MRANSKALRDSISMHANILNSQRCFTVVAIATICGQMLYNPRPSLGQTAAPASSEFKPLVEADAVAAWQKVVAAAGAVEQRFSTDPVHAPGWKQYLDWDKFTPELSKAKPDMTIVGATYAKLSAGHDGLEQRYFYDLREALRGYLTVASGVGNADLKEAVEKHLADLKTATAGPLTTENQQAVADNLDWLESAGQAADLVRETRGHYAQPNIYISVGGDMLSAVMSKPVDEVAPIQDCILGTAIQGCGHTMGSTSVRLCPDPTHGSYEILLQAVNCSNNLGSHAPVTINSTGATSLYAVKQVWFDGEGTHLGRAAASASTHSTIQGITDQNGRRIVEKIATRRADKQMPEAEAIASAHASARLGKQFDEQSDPRLLEADQRFNEKVRFPLAEMGVYPKSVGYSTDASAIHITAVQAGAGQLAAADAPPALSVPVDLSASIHESAANNLLERFLTGMRLTDEMVDRLTAKYPVAQQKLPPDPGVKEEDKTPTKEPFTVVFPREQLPKVEPVTVSFVENGYSITLRGREFDTGDKRQPGMNITANYTFEKTAQGYKAVRKGDLDIYGYGMKPGSMRTGAQMAIYTVLQRKFGRVFAKEIPLDGFTPQGDLAAAGKMVPVEIVAKAGWITIGWKREVVK
jgi:hypothetical protein